MKRRNFATFSLSFIDAILCGFGAVILLFLIVSNQSRSQRVEQTLELRSEVDRLAKQVEAGKRDLVEVTNSRQQQDELLDRFEGLARQIRQIEQQKRQQVAALDKENIATRAHINRLKADLESAEEDNKRLEAGSSSATEQGDRVREHLGDGQRQYLTGIKLNGRRTLVLLDVSASMLGEKVVDVIVRRNLSNADKKKSPKWRRTLATIDWLSSQLPPEGQFQIYGFNKDVFPVLRDKSGQWQSAGDPAALNMAVNATRKLVPAHGTNLLKAFELATQLTPKPDNIVLITDGLPTLGSSSNFGGKVSAEKRLTHFREALDKVDMRIPVNTIILPMEGDPAAAPAYWSLAKRTNGSFFSPSRDWP